MASRGTKLCQIDASSISRGIVDLRGKFEKVVLNNHFEPRTVQRIKKGKCSRFFYFGSRSNCDVLFYF